MAKSVLDIVIKLSKEGGADKDTIKGLVQVKRSILDAAAVTGTFIAAGLAVNKILNETVGTLVQYADQVRRVQNATGASAEDASKLIQILDDQKISYESLEKVIQKNGKAYDFSIAGIARMSDQYLKLENAQDRAAFMQQRFGKSWLDFVPIMQKGEKGILAAADAVDKSLVLTQKAVDATREYEISMDNLNDSAQGLKLTFAQDVLPAINQVLDGVNVYIRAQQIMAENTNKSAHGNMAFKDALAQATLEVAQQKLALKDHAAALDGDTQSAEEAAKAQKELSAAHQSMLGLITSIANENKNYAQTQADLTQKMQENRAEAAKLYPWQKQQLDELNKKYVDMQTTYQQNAEAHSAAMGKIQYDLFVTKISVDGITDAEFAMAQQAGLTFGVFDQNSVNQANNMNALADAVNNGKIQVEDMGRALDMLDKTHDINVVIHTLNAVGSGHSIASGTQNNNTGPGGGNGHAQSFASGTSGWMTVPPGLPNDSYPIWTSSGEQFAVIPNGAPSPIPGVGAGGGGNTVIQLVISSPVTILDKQTAQNVLLPYIIDGYREAQARGAIK